MSSHPRIKSQQLVNPDSSDGVKVEGELNDGLCFFFYYRRGLATLGLGRDQEDAHCDCCEVITGYDSLQRIAFDSDQECDALITELLDDRLTKPCQPGWTDLL